MDFETFEREITFSFSRSSGKGGQNVNKVSTKATLFWNIQDSMALPPDVKERFVKAQANKISADGTFIISSEQHRDQKGNIRECLEKLQDLIEQVWRAPKKRFKTKPTRGSNERRLKSKSTHKQKKSGRARIKDW